MYRYSKMPPQEQQKTWVLYESDAVNDSDVTNRVAPTAEKRVWKIVWRNVLLMGFAHIGGLYGAYLFLFKAKWLTCLFGKFQSDLETLNSLVKQTYFMKYQATAACFQIII